MIRLARSRLALSIAATAAVATAGSLALGVAAFAHGGDQPAPNPNPAPADPNEKPVFLAAVLQGRNEVPAPGGPAVGDKDGQAVQVLRIKGDQVAFSLTWKKIGAPTAGHIHLGATGTNGAVKIPFFGTPLPGTLNAAVGKVTITDKALLDSIKANPTGFYANLHTAEFPGGAVRGQLFRTGFGHAGFQPGALNASVISGEQIYNCTQQPNGSFTYTQHNVRAVLNGDIQHSFVKDAAGPPQWVAPDGSAVTGKLVTRIPNGDKNIPELDLAATSIGKDKGRFSSTVEILRLNTVGGLAPTGSCDPKTKPIARSPYKADYLFIG